MESEKYTPGKMKPEEIVESLPGLGGSYAFYFHRVGQPAVLAANAARFSSASLIKIPILLACAALERQGELSLDELCDLDTEAQVKGAGFARRMKTRQLPYHDVLLMMIATSDNLCTNLAIRRVGLERLNRLFREELGLEDTQLQRKLMDLEARDRGLDNWVSPQDCIRLFARVRELPPNQQAWVAPMLLQCQDSALLLRDLPRDSIRFYHKTGSIQGILHDWGFTRECEIFLLTQGFQHEHQAVQLFGQAGQLLA